MGSDAKIDLEKVRQRCSFFFDLVLTCISQNIIEINSDDTPVGSDLNWGTIATIIGLSDLFHFATVRHRVASLEG